jgi:hypothetical protein
MKFMRVFIILLVASLPAAFVVVNAFKPRECVTVSVQGLDTKYHYRDTQFQAAVVIISNLGPHILNFDVALQTKEHSWWKHPMSIQEFSFDDGPSDLQPFSQRIFHLPIPVSPIPYPWRVVVVCHLWEQNLNKLEKLYFQIRSWFIPDYAYHYYFVSKELPLNTALEPTAAAPSVSNVPSNPKADGGSAPVPSGGGSALDR